MLGSIADAEDLVQETFIRWQSSAEADVHSPRAYLVTILSVACVSTNWSPLGSSASNMWVHGCRSPCRPEPPPILSTHLSCRNRFLWHSCFCSSGSLRSSVPRFCCTTSSAMTMTNWCAFSAGARPPADKLCIAHVGTSPKTVRGSNRRPKQHERLLHEFVAAASSGNLEGLVSVLSNEVVLYSDGGGKANAALRPLHGALNVGRFVLGAIAKSVPNDVSLSIETVNGQP